MRVAKENEKLAVRGELKDISTSHKLKLITYNCFYWCQPTYTLICSIPLPSISESHSENILFFNYRWLQGEMLCIVVSHFSPSESFGHIWRHLFYLCDILTSYVRDSQTYLRQLLSIFSTWHLFVYNSAHPTYHLSACISNL